MHWVKWDQKKLHAQIFKSEVFILKIQTAVFWATTLVLQVVNNISRDLMSL
jgi:hypothetical protein